VNPLGSMAPPAVKLQAIGMAAAEYGLNRVRCSSPYAMLSSLLRRCVIEYIFGSYFSDVWSPNILAIGSSSWCWEWIGIVKDGPGASGARGAGYLDIVVVPICCECVPSAV
jgi:hypothetical protein